MTREQWLTRFPRLREANYAATEDGFHTRELTHEAAHCLNYIPVKTPILGIEVGTCQAKSACIMLHKRPKLTLCLVDCWPCWPEVRVIAEHNLTQFPGRWDLIVGDSTETARTIQPACADFVFIDASKAPPFDFVRRYLGPAGLFATAEEDGWFFKGFTLPKQQ